MKWDDKNKKWIYDPRPQKEYTVLIGYSTHTDIYAIWAVHPEQALHTAGQDRIKSADWCAISTAITFIKHPQTTMTISADTGSICLGGRGDINPIESGAFRQFWRSVGEKVRV